VKQQGPLLGLHSQQGPLNSLHQQQGPINGLHPNLQQQPQPQQSKVKIFFSLPEVKPGSNIKIPNVSHIQVCLSNLFFLTETLTMENEN
jgi:hypothetical protein